MRHFVERTLELNAACFGSERATGARFINGQNDLDLFFAIRWFEDPFESNGIRETTESTS